MAWHSLLITAMLEKKEYVCVYRVSDFPEKESRGSCLKTFPQDSFFRRFPILQGKIVIWQQHFATGQTLIKPTALITKFKIREDQPCIEIPMHFLPFFDDSEL